MPFTTINGIKLYYEDHGEGEPVMLLHHGFGCTKIWKGIWPALVKNGYRVIMYDREGFGQTGKRSDWAEYYVSDSFNLQSISEMDAFASFMGLDSFHILAQCEGGVIGVEYAIHYSHRVKTLITSSTQCYSTMTMREFGNLKWPDPFTEIDPEMQKKFIYWHGKDYAEDFFNLARVAGGAYGIGFFDIRESLEKVQCPSLVIYPDRSVLFDVQQGVDFYKALPKGELSVLAKCGHNTYELQPEEYIRNVLSFLNRHGY